MLFDLRPKERKEDLYDRTEEIGMIKENLQRKTWVAVLGVRRIGKTSIVNVALSETGSIAVKLNLVRLYEGNRKFYSRESFIALFLEGINSAIKNYTIGAGAIKRISNVLGMEADIFFDFNPVRLKPKIKKLESKDIGNLIMEMDEIAKDNKKQLVLVFDEAQELSKVAGINFPAVFQDIYDFRKDTSVVFTGSMVGLLENVLNEIEYGEPFFGRFIRKIYLQKFDRGSSIDFLKRGFKEEEVEVSEDVIYDAVKKFDGIPGWLTLFGSEYSFSVKHNRKPEIDAIVEMAVKEVREEVKKFILKSQARERYSAVILALDRLGGKGTLSEISKVAGTLLGEEIAESRTYELLHRLSGYGFIKENQGEYSLPEDVPDRRGSTEAAKEAFSM